MKSALPVFAALVLASQISVAQARDDSAQAALEEVVVTAPAVEEQPIEAEKPATDRQLKSLEHNPSSSLQSKLDAQLNFEFGARPASNTEVAAVN